VEQDIEDLNNIKINLREKIENDHLGKGRSTFGPKESKALSNRTQILGDSMDNIMMDDDESNLEVHTPNLRIPDLPGDFRFSTSKLEMLNFDKQSSAFD
jgi:hypothetical protein